MNEQLEMLPKRKECPFCKSTRSTVKRVWKTYWFVACDNCKAGGPIKPTTQEAEEAWDRRD